MKIIRFFLLLLIPSHLIGYSHQCASSHITTFSEPNDYYHTYLDNNLRNLDNVTFAVRNFDTNTSSLDIISFQLISENDNVKFYGEVEEINNGNIDIDVIDQLFQDFVDTDYTANELGTFKGIKNALEEMLGLPL